MNEPSTTGSALIAQYLEGEGIPFRLVEHPRTSSAYGDARATHRRPESVGKTVVLREGSGYVLAVLPASHRLDLRKLREVLGASRQLQLIDEAEMAHEFPEFEVGAIPPFGVGLPAAEVVDSRLLDEDRIVCAGGDHAHAILIDPRDVVAVAGAKVADICQD
jgi:Ala-tRNA(Pro) deacylase